MEIICTICLNPLIHEEEEVATIPCRHVFHKRCLKTWLKIEQRCPQCAATTKLENISKRLFLTCCQLKLPPSEQPQDVLEKTALQLTRELKSKEQTIKEIKLANQCLFKQLEEVKGNAENQMKTKVKLQQIKVENRALKAKLSKRGQTENTNAELKEQVRILQLKLQESTRSANITMSKYHKYKRRSGELEQRLKRALSGVRKSSQN